MSEHENQAGGVTPRPTLLEQADPHLSAVRSVIQALGRKAKHRQPLDTARWHLFEACRDENPVMARAWLNALEAAVRAGLAETPPTMREGLLRAMDGLSAVVAGEGLR